MEFSIEEANAIISDSKHPHYADFYHHQKPDVVAAVNKAFEAATPGTTTLGGGEDLPAHLNDAMNREAGISQAPEATQPQASGGEPLLDADQVIAQIEQQADLDPQTKEIQRQAIESLRGAWGYAFKENFRDYQHALGAMVTSPQEFQEFCELQDKLGLADSSELQAQVARLFSRAGRRLREKFSSKG